MGCDIHAHLEIFVKNEWLYYAQAEIERRYAVFARMANVRNDGTVIPMCEPRGIPHDASLMTELHYGDWGSEAHSASYLIGFEIKELIDWYRKWLKREGINVNDTEFAPWEQLGIWLFGNSIYSFFTGSEFVPDFIKDIRLVFWFDN